MVSPVWYTVLVSRSSAVAAAKDRWKQDKDGEDAEYVLSGGPTNRKEEAWLKRKLKPDSPVKIIPRFFLDGWEQKDYANLLSNANNWNRLANAISEEVEKRNYDGVILESAATHLLFEPIQTLASALKALEPRNAKPRILTAALPPLRTKHSLGGEKPDTMQDSQNRMIVQSIPQLAQVVDFFSIMTYGMSSAGGRVSRISGKEFPDDSPLRGAKKGSLRQPGPNTSPKWVEENMAMIEQATRAAAKAKLVKTKKQQEQEQEEEERQEQEDVEKLKDPSSPFLYDDFAATEVLDEDEEKAKEKQFEEEQQVIDELALIRGKLLMGMPMYGYQYPVFWIDKAVGQGVPVPPPANAAQAKQLLARADTSADSALLAFLRGPGEALTMDGIVSVLTDNDGVIVDTKQSDGEGWFDYAETITKETLKARQSHGVKEGDQIYWRLYLPLPSATRTRLTALDNKAELQAGLSLWELGQASPILLNDL
ncbi:hypothetical protein NDA16_002410 [Ustilago loliicola]|nr:hypothetical protein NDA16_002410 [Ustilago loliicola]